MSYTGILILSSKYLEKDEFYEKIIRGKTFRILTAHSDGLI